MDKDKIQYITDNRGNKYFFKVVVGSQTITLYRDIDNQEIMSMNYKNAYRMLDLLEKAIQVIDEDE